MTYPETSDDAYTRRARQMRHLIKALREGLDILEHELATNEHSPHGWDDVDKEVMTKILIEAVAALRQGARDDLEPELLGD